ncbi:MAG: glycoside hydrolase family 3 C-terminal domain-containing protein [Chloroflexi bacterium]|nr:glycoside hydrolase family 3 C-terminal domain-containing protein [Chloroflexota bacterium]
MSVDIKKLISQLTLEEKAALCTGETAWTTVPVERLGIPSIWVSDGPHGLRKTPIMAAETSIPATCFPTASAQAATWDVDLVQTIGQALGDECIAQSVDVVLGPGNNMKRTPLCGRNFEYYSEDPFLGGEMAAALINGVQSKGVGTSLKHFATNNQEYQRMTISAEMDERTLREIYLAGFERAVKKGKPWTVMCSYNRLRGTHASQNRYLLTDILKNEWGYEGFIVSDWGAVHDRVAALQAGLDLEMPGPQKFRVQRVVTAVQKGELDLAVLDAAVERILKIVFKAAETPKGKVTLDVDGHHALARKIASEAIVLLKNEGGILPLKNIKRLAVIGKASKEPYFQGGGSSHINPTKVDIPFDELKKLAGSMELLYADGDTMQPGLNQPMIDEAVKVAAQADVALLYIALPPFKESEGIDRPDIDLTDHQVALIKAVSAKQPRCVVILNNGSAVAVGEWINGVAAVLEAWMMGQAGGGAIADVLFGKVNPSGHLSETFPIKLSDTPATINYPGENGKVNYGEGLFIGYRYYDAKAMGVQFPFGYGLSYTTFEFKNLRVSSEKFRDVDGLKVSVDVTNSGAVAGAAVVQLYVHDEKSELVRPVKELKGFAKVMLQPGETRTVNIALDERAFAYYHPRHHQWVTESGAFEILIGKSAGEIVLRHTVQMESTQQRTAMLDRDSTLLDWMNHPRGNEIIKPLIEQAMKNLPADTPIPDWAKDLPMEVVLMWFANQSLTKAPEEMIEDLLALTR